MQHHAFRNSSKKEEGDINKRRKETAVSCLLPFFLLPAAGHKHAQSDKPHQEHKSRCPLMGSGLSLGRNVNLCPQPLGYALYNRPITTKSKTTSRDAVGQMPTCQ